jgi:hypothetical protein
VYGTAKRNETACFRRFEIRTDPIRVFDEIPRERISDGSEGRYLEATFEGRGLFERLRLMVGSNVEALDARGKMADHPVL